MTAAVRHERLDGLAMGLMLLLCAAWGVQQVAVKVAIPGVAPLLQAALRSLGAVLLLALWCAWRRIPLFGSDATLRPGLLAASLFAAEFAFIYWGLDYTLASRGVIFLYTAPFFVALGATWLLPGERLRLPQWAGLAAAFAGIAMLFADSLRLPSGRELIGDAMMLVAAVFWAATTLTVKASVLNRVSAEKTLFYQLAGSALLLAAASLGCGESWRLHLTPLIVASLAYQAVLVAGISFLVWFWLVKHYPATQLSAFSFMTPLFGVLAGSLLLGEPLSAALIGALLLVGSGIWLVNRPAR